MLILGGASLLAVTLAWIVGYVLSAIATALAVWGELRDERAQNQAEESVGGLAKFGLKGMLGSFSPTETLRADQAIVGVVLSPTALGLYTTALAFTNLPRLIAQSLGLVVYPRAAATEDPVAALRSVWRFVGLATGITLAIVLVLEAATPFLIELLFGAEFLPAADATRILLIGTVFLAARRVLGDGVRGLGHPEASTYAELVSWALLLPALLVLASTDSLEAVSAAVAGSYAVSFVALLLLTSRLRRRLPKVSPQEAAP
jgi:O-antigen/teichoic acid export membrane protein